MSSSQFVKNLNASRKNFQNRAAKKDQQVREFNFSIFNPHKQGKQTVADDLDFDLDAVSSNQSLLPKIRLVNQYCSKEDFISMIPPETESLTLTELFKQVSPPEFKRPPEASPNFIVFGIVATRSVTRVSAQGNKFVTLTLSDLKYDVSLALHGKAHEKFWKVRPGTLIALFNPQFYVQKFENTARTLALSVSKETCLVEIGQAKDLGQCESMTSASQYSKRCKNWVDVRKTHVCEFHTEQKAIRTKRPEFNASSAKLWDPMSSGSRSVDGGGSAPQRLTVYEGGEVSWKRGLQVDSQANFGRSGPKKPAFGPGGFYDAPVGRVFQADGANAQRRDSKNYEESIREKRSRLQKDRRKLERFTDDATLKAQLGASSVAYSQNSSQGVTKQTKSTPHTTARPFARSQLRKLGFVPLRAPTKRAESSLPPKSETQLRTAQANTSSYNDSESDLEII